MRSLANGLVFAFVILTTSVHAEPLPLQHKVLVLDYQLLGDTTLKNYQARDAALMMRFGDYLRQQIRQQKHVVVADSESELALLREEARAKNLHWCNGCENMLANKLGADYVVVPWVFRMSILIQTMYLEIRNVHTGQVVVHMGKNFRGNTEAGWQHSVDSLLRDLPDVTAWE